MKLTIANVPLTSKIKIYQNDHLIEWFRGGDTHTFIKHVDMTKPIRIEVESSLVKRLLHPILLPLLYLLFDYFGDIAPYHSVYRVTAMPQEEMTLRLNRKQSIFETKDELKFYQNDCYMKGIDFLMSLLLFVGIDSTTIYLWHVMIASQLENLWGTMGILVGILFIFVWVQYQDAKQLYRLYQKSLQ